MARLLMVLVTIILVAEPAIAAAPKSPKGPWSTDTNSNRIGFRIAGTFKLDGRKTGLFIKDLYVSTSIRCERKDSPGEFFESNDIVSFPGSDRRPLLYDKKSGFFELGINRATAVRGHTGSAPFGNANYGQGRLQFALVMGGGGKTGLAQVKFTAEGGAPPMGTLVGTETLGPCDMHTFKGSLARGNYFP